MPGRIRLDPQFQRRNTGIIGNINASINRFLHGPTIRKDLEKILQAHDDWYVGQTRENIIRYSPQSLMSIGILEIEVDWRTLKQDINKIFSSDFLKFEQARKTFADIDFSIETASRPLLKSEINAPSLFGLNNWALGFIGGATGTAIGFAWEGKIHDGRFWGRMPTNILEHFGAKTNNLPEFINSLIVDFDQIPYPAIAAVIGFIGVPVISRLSQRIHDGILRRSVLSQLGQAQEHNFTRRRTSLVLSRNESANIGQILANTAFSYKKGLLPFWGHLSISGALSERDKSILESYIFQSHQPKKEESRSSPPQRPLAKIWQRIKPKTGSFFKRSHAQTQKIWENIKLIKHQDSAILYIASLGADKISELEKNPISRRIINSSTLQRIRALLNRGLTPVQVTIRLILDKTIPVSNSEAYKDNEFIKDEEGSDYFKPISSSRALELAKDHIASAREAAELISIYLPKSILGEKYSDDDIKAAIEIIDQHPTSKRNQIIEEILRTKTLSFRPSMLQIRN